METDKDHISIIKQLTKLDTKIDNMSVSIKESNATIKELAKAITDLRVIQNRVAEQEKKITTLFNKYDELHNDIHSEEIKFNSILYSFMKRVNIMLIGEGLVVVGMLIVFLITHIK